nr:MAG TPA: hypothetical protein [Caudoviricetes sp.]
MHTSIFSNPPNTPLILTFYYLYITYGYIGYIW